jgi:ABC-2 type transport system ATP-binding protein
MDACYLPQRQLAWFDHWLRGRGSAGPGFTWFEDWQAYDGAGPDDEQYGTARRFPLAGRTTVALGDAPATIVNPAGGQPAAYTETSNFTGPDASPSLADVPPTEVEGQHADFDTAPLARAAEVVGIPAARLVLSHVDGQDLVVFLKVYDVAPDGTATLVHRLITPVRVADVALSEPVDVRLVGFAHRFEAGHSIRLTAATTDLTSYGAKVADAITIDAAASTVTWPGRLTFQQ